jgi:hypothetical protein
MYPAVVSQCSCSMLQLQGMQPAHQQSVVRQRLSQQCLCQVSRQHKATARRKGGVVLQRILQATRHTRKHRGAGVTACPVARCAAVLKLLLVHCYSTAADRMQGAASHMSTSEVLPAHLFNGHVGLVVGVSDGLCHTVACPIPDVAPVELLPWAVTLHGTRNVGHVAQTSLALHVQAWLVATVACDSI